LRNSFAPDINLMLDNNCHQHRRHVPSHRSADIFEGTKV